MRCFAFALALAAASSLAPVGPLKVGAAHAQSAAYSDGLTDRTAYEGWFATLKDQERTGAEYWASQRSLRSPGPCARSDGNAGWVAGCRGAQRRLAPADARRLSEPEYRLGWNAYQENSQPAPAAPSPRAETLPDEQMAAAPEPTFAAPAPPHYDIQSNCDGLANNWGGVQYYAKFYAGCVQKEEADYNVVKTIWPHASERVRNLCAKFVERGGGKPSYQILSACISSPPGGLQTGEVAPSKPMPAAAEPTASRVYKLCMMEDPSCWPLISDAYNRACADRAMPAAPEPVTAKRIFVTFMQAVEMWQHNAATKSVDDFEATNVRVNIGCWRG